MPPPQAQILQVLRRDPVLVPIIDSLPFPHKHNEAPDLYYDLLDSIVSQQLSIKAAATIFERFNNLFPGKYPYPELLLALLPDELRGVGLSYQKAKYLQNVAQFWLDEQLENQHLLQMSDEEVLTKLCAIKGVGEWTVQMILMFSLNRENVFPIGDLGVRDAMMRLYAPEAASKKELMQALHAIADQWQPHRSVACKYLWKWRDQLLRAPK